MRNSRSHLLGAVALALLALSLGASEGDVEYRQHTMAAVGGHTQALFDILGGKVSHTEHLAAHADALKALSGVATTLFPAGSGGGESHALPAIWEDPEDFAERARQLRGGSGEPERCRGGRRRGDACGHAARPSLQGLSRQLPRRVTVGATLVVARSGTVRDSQTGRDKPGPGHA